MICCQNPLYKLLEELGHAESVDWALSKCITCGALILEHSSEYGGAYGDVLTEGEAWKFRKAQGRARIDLLKKWYNEH